MYKAVFLSVLSACILSCGMAQEAAKDMPNATYFMTPDMDVPSGADMSRGDVPRDGYGRPYTYAFLGKKLPIFDGVMADGKSFSSLSLEGSWAVIRVWGMWCHDSRGELEEAAKLASDLEQTDGLIFMSIHVPQNAENAGRALRGYEALSDFFEEAGYSYQTLMDEDATLRETLKIRWTPSYILVAPDGSVQGFRTSLADAGEDAVDTFLQDIKLTQAKWSFQNSIERLAE